MTTTPATEAMAMTPEQRNKAVTKAVVSGIVGSALEWYDFVLFGSASALVFNKLFFPTLNPLLGTAAALMANSVAFAIRPLGGLIFGSLGDKLGRRSVLAATLLLMGVSTTVIGLLPTYSQVGVIAPILLLICRACEGLAVGAEFSGATVLVSEYASKRRQGFLTSLTGAGLSLGIALASIIFGIFSSLPQEQFLSWGWRVPFLLSILGVFVGLYVRLQVMETPEFQAVTKQKDVQPKAPLKVVYTKHLRSSLLGILACFSENATTNLVKTFALAYLVQFLQVKSAVGLNAILWGSLACLVTYPIFGMLADRFQFKNVYLASAIMTGLFTFPFFMMLNTKDPVIITLAVILMYAVAVRGMSATQGAYLSNHYPTAVRFTGVASSREIASAFSGGLSPVLGTIILAQTNSWVPVAWYMVGMAVVSVIATIALGEGKYRPLGAQATPEAIAMQEVTTDPVTAQ